LKESTIKTKRNSNTSFLNTKENDAGNSNFTPKITEKDLLVQEIVKLTKESNTFKFQMRTLSENYKKIEKENTELKKNCEVKSESLEKLRKEIADLSKILNTDRFKSIKMIETDLHKALAINKALQEEIIGKEKENSVMQEDLKHLKRILEKITKEIDGSEEQKNKDSQKEIEKIAKIQEKNIEELKEMLKFKEEQLKLKEEGFKEIVIQSENLNDEVEYFKNMAKNSKGHADKAIKDLDYYRNKLMEMQTLNKN